MIEMLKLRVKLSNFLFLLYFIRIFDFLRLPASWTSLQVPCESSLHQIWHGSHVDTRVSHQNMFF